MTIFHDSKFHIFLIHRSLPISALHADHDPGDTQQVAGAAALDDTALNDAVFIYIHSHFTGAYALGLVNIYHKKFLLWITSDSCIPLKEHS